MTEEEQIAYVTKNGENIRRIKNPSEDIQFALLQS